MIPRDTSPLQMHAWTVSPDVKIELRGDRFRVSRFGAAGYVEVDDARVLNLLRAGAHSELTTGLGRDFDAFIQIGVILPETRATEARPQTAGDYDSKAAQNRRDIRAILRAIGQCLRDIAGDLQALEPRFDREFGLMGQLTRCLRGVENVKNELLSRHGGNIDAQLQRISLTRQSTSLRLHLGSGPRELEGWTNIDCYPAQFAMNLNRALPFADGSVDYVFFSHTLEHFYYPDEALAVLKEVRRVLSRSGRIRIVVPDMRKFLEAYAKDDDDFFNSRRRVWTWLPEGRTRLVETLAYAGAGASIDGESHKFGYDFDTLRSLLIEAGFTGVEQSEYMQSKDPVLRVDSASLVAGATFSGGYYSLFVEASRDIA